MNSRIALITYMDGSGGAGPDNSLPGSPAYPSHGLPPGAVQLPVFPFDPTIPDNSLPGSQPGIDNSLPGGRPERPDNSLPPVLGAGRPDQGLPPSPGRPDNSLPPAPARPVQPIAPGGRFVVKWLACHGLILVPDNSLPPAPEPK